MSTQDYVQAAKSIYDGIRHGREEVRAHLDLVNENLQVDVLDQSDFLTSENKVAGGELDGRQLEEER